MPRLRDIIGVGELLRKEYRTLPFEGSWANHLGYPEQGFTALIYGPSGEGKSTYTARLCKYLASLFMDTSTAAVLYNSHEEGHGRSIQKLAEREGWAEVAGKITIGDALDFEALKKRMGTKNTERIVVIDSLDFMGLTYRQWQELRELYPHKGLIIIAWSAGMQPYNEHAKAIKYASMIKVRVSQFMAYPTSRYGGNVPYNIWPDWADHMGGLVGQQTRNNRAAQGRVFVLQKEALGVDSRTFSILEHIGSLGVAVKKTDVPKGAHKCWPKDTKEMAAADYAAWLSELEVADLAETEVVGG